MAASKTEQKSWAYLDTSYLIHCLLFCFNSKSIKKKPQACIVTTVADPMEHGMMEYVRVDSEKADIASKKIKIITGGRGKGKYW